ncbi:MAG: 4-alpha-glucanotransferase [Candidatus Sabulitectum sp.]|nr:4-alpha-glucanotransferase [Candidatus Sabulitectum sp.]
MLFEGDTGVLLHPTSLPGKWGIGTLGSEAMGFSRWMAGSGITVWQVLPVSPPVYANSPYQALSSFAGNPLLISPEELFKLELLSSSELAAAEVESFSQVSWKRLSGRTALLELAARRALDRNLAGFEEFSRIPWVMEWSRFATGKALNGGMPWTLWKKTAPEQSSSELVHGMIQFFFHMQWMQLKEHCNSLGIRILGDVPIYTAHDSSDVFFNREIFKLDMNGMPSVVAGVPPDYFSETGQLWGNPVYNWDACARSGYSWWIKRMAVALDLFDAVRIDHFRGFAEYWEIPAGEATAVNGKWVKGPGIELFRQMEKALGKLPVVAEDLGLITPSVQELRKQCGFPGMVVLQFTLQDQGFSLSEVDPSSVVYTGTHDNDTTAGWIRSVGRELGFNSVRSLVEMALSSPAGLAVLPMQDILELDSSARMNTPSEASGNWGWRMTELPAIRGFSRSS